MFPYHPRTMIAPASKIRVMVVDDSVVIRGLIGRVIDAEPDMEIAASAPNGRVALELLRHREIDVLLLDIEMPEMDGLTALPQIVASFPGVRVIMASSLTAAGAQVTLRALSLGAADYIAKPSSRSIVQGASVVTRDLVAKIRALGRSRRPAPAWPAGDLGAGAPPAASAPAPAAAAPAASSLRRGAPLRAVIVASSTGGPNALGRFLADLGPGFPLPVVLVQHMPEYFTSVLAERLEREGGRPCREAVHGELLQPGRTYVAPGNHHLRLTRHAGEIVLRLDQSAPVHYCRPSADPTFVSAADALGEAALGVVLTGMGEDALDGCRALVAAGGRVLAQDAATSVVWGMPGAVAAAGLAHAVLPIDRIGAYVLDACATAV
jgi:two-component system, chemotaxis family, protein-glutamate methylesterase/glutaminase